MSNLGKWDNWYSVLPADKPGSFRYGDTETYRLGAEFLADCETVEDWGTGAGGFLRHCPRAIGIDGSVTPYAQTQADLREYRSNVDGIFIRHVLEHDSGWRDILMNALLSCRKKLCLVLFTPFSEETHIIADNTRAGVSVPDISFRREDIELFFKNSRFLSQTLKTNTGYGVEHVYYVSI